MEISLESGTYVVAVSGGVDSMVLLDMLVHRPDLRLIVAHFDHGIRHDSELDRRLVQEIAGKHRLPFVYDEGHLGPDTNEAVARKARYNFLHRVLEVTGARAIVTAHHLDDALETAILNILRGTGRKGLASLQTTDKIARPLLHVSKKQILDYAKDHDVQWREDTTNQDLRYTRNYIRHRLLPHFSQKDREKLANLITKMRELNHEIELQLIGHFHVQPALDQLDRHWLIMLPHKVAQEVMAAWLRRHHIRGFSKKTIDRLIVAAKTLKSGKVTDIDEKSELVIGKRLLRLKQR